MLKRTGFEIYKQHLKEGWIFLDHELEEVVGIHPNGFEVCLATLCTPDWYPQLLDYLEDHPNPEDW